MPPRRWSALLRLTRTAARRRNALLEIASGLGADVPFFLFGGRALGTGRGDEIYPLPDLPRRTVLVVSPRGHRREHARRLPLARPAIDKAARRSLDYGVSALYAGARREAPLERFRGGCFPAVSAPRQYSRGSCSSKELRKPRWRVAVRRCLEFSETQRRRAELPSSFRKTRSSFARRFRGAAYAAPCGVRRGRLQELERRRRSERIARLDRRQIQDF